MVLVSLISFVMLIVISIFSFLIIIIIMFLPSGEYKDICTHILEDDEPSPSTQENFTSSICSKKHKLDSVKGNLFFEKASDGKYTSELKNAELMSMFKKYTVNRTLYMSKLVLDVERAASNSFAIYLQNEITRWFFDKGDLNDFRCVLAVPRMVHKHDKNDTIEPNENISFSTEALIHRQSKNIGKHLLIEGEILQNKLNVNFIKIIGSIYHDNLFFDKFSTFSSTSAPYLSIYDYYQY